MSDKNRERLLQILTDAPYEILLCAVEDYKAFRIRQAESTSAVFKYFGDGKPKAAVVEVQMTPGSPEPTPPQEVVKTHKFITPPGEPTAKIGSETEASVIAHLRSGPDNLQNLAVVMKRNEKAAEGLLARLCLKKKIAYRSDKLYCLSN